MSSVYRVEGTTAFTSEYAAGPWGPMQHGGAPSSLVAWAAERMTPREPMQISRITVDLLRPVPIAPLEIRTEVLREGRKIQLCSVILAHENVPCVRASVLKIRQIDATAEIHHEEPVLLPGPDQGVEREHGTGRANAFITGMTIRTVRGAFREPGPGAAWFRANRPIVEGEPISAEMRAAMTADFCNGLASVVDFRRWSYINADLTISLSRRPVGEWILLDAQTWLGGTGSGIAFARLGDERGYFGRAIQSLVIEPR
jgi:Acyl-CoA thioesterase N-terminal domain/Acyl-CoA thioesterase C-terminal domain